MWWAKGCVAGVLAVGAMGCEPAPLAVDGGLPELVATTQARDFELEVCRSRIAEVKATEGMPGTPAFDENRAAVLGRAVGEPMVFVRAPAAADGTKPGAARVSRLRARHRYDKAALRSEVLREGYVYSDDPQEAYALVWQLRLRDLFGEDKIYLQRGDRTFELERRKSRYVVGKTYFHVGGVEDGREAKILFGDRVATNRADLATPLHRDVRSLRDRVGFERIRVTHRTNEHLLADVRFGGEWVTALIASDGAKLTIACLDASVAERKKVHKVAEASASRRRAVAALQASVDALVGERLPFDRPRGAEDHFDDGQLRARWEWAYKRGAHSFTHDEEGYLVFDLEGRPYPPQTCVEMVVDGFERASGNWFGAKGAPRKRTAGGLDFGDFGIKSRNGVLAFEKFAKATPELFVHRRLPQADRVPFKKREAFFDYLVKNADAFQPGDIVAIQGVKRDGHIHQHAILIKDTDPVTGMPHALTDQMKRPRHRSWEGIMAEAPLRSLLYHITPTPQLMARLDRGQGDTRLTATAPAKP